MQCLKKKQDGTPCKARALTGKNCCAFHCEPGKAAELGSRGGRRRAVHAPEDLKAFQAPKTAADLRDLLAQSIVEIRAGKMDPRMANAISYVGTGFLRAVELADIEQRLETLERGAGGLADGKPEAQS